MSVPLSDDQLAVLKAIHGEFEREGRWPIWQYVHRGIRPLGSAEAALRSLPQVRDRGPGVGWQYGLVTFDNNFGPGIPSPEDQIRLTVAGLHRLGMSDPVVALLVQSLRHMVEQEAQLAPSPTEVVQCIVSSQDLERVLFDGKPTDRDVFHLAQLRLVLSREQPFWGGMSPSMESPDWEVRVPADIARFEGVESADEYIDRVCNDIAPPAPPFDRSIPSPLSVPMAVSFLDAVWTAHLGESLFRNVDPERAARLVQPVGTADEFDSCTSALTDVLARIVVPADDGIQRKSRRAVAVLDDWLTKRLPEQSAYRTHSALDVLGKIVDIRVGAQHTNARHKVIAAFDEFGLAFPPLDWAIAWETLRAGAVGALEAIREEVQAYL